MKTWLIILGWFVACGLLAPSALAQTRIAAMVLADDGERTGYVAQIEAHTKPEIEALMDRAEAVVDQVLSGKQIEPIQFVLHGDEVRLFFRRNYKENKALVDRAARLDAFDVIDIKVCETWMRIQRESEAELYPFIETVPLGPAEERRLLNEGYIYF